MNRRVLLLVTTTIIGVCGAVGAGVFAEQPANDGLQIQSAHISLTQAIAAAEAKTGGKASRAVFEASSDGWVYGVEVVAGGVVSDVKVNPEDGSVMSVREDKLDQDDDEDEAED